jgi:hypothetical protein
MKSILARLTSLVVLAAMLAACSPAAATPTEVGDLDHARQTLIDYFSALHNGDYAAAITRQAYDEDYYTWLRQNNPDIDPNDRAALMQAACTYQLVCREVKQVLRGEQSAENEFEFWVEFANEDGTLFVLGPCCGENETTMPPVSEFQFFVERVDSEFLVHGGPVYMP